jgi:hypothetical protein
MKDKSGTAFPLVKADEVYSGGMSLRDYFAGQALAGILSHSDFTDGSGTTMNSFVMYAKSSYDFADAMLAERAKG